MKRKTQILPAFADYLQRVENELGSDFALDYCLGRICEATIIFESTFETSELYRIIDFAEQALDFTNKEYLITYIGEIIEYAENLLKTQSEVAKVNTPKLIVNIALKGIERTEK